MYQPSHQDVKIKLQKVETKLDALEAKKSRAIFNRIEEI